ncbi:hypothetical protein B0I35DRAFT_507210 [Stachybotrys elegans]|uniref:Uncharacterized protein n=1 Tax=Stachybotrys elegans TaxID=80388 RepID=A0A8K0T267_9HYPO|nr:hypothetical protein B0I35DRAFT_507210 [Stachybotrys elegans]
MSDDCEQDQEERVHHRPGDGYVSGILRNAVVHIGDTQSPGYDEDHCVVTIRYFIRDGVNQQPIVDVKLRLTQPPTTNTMSTTEDIDKLSSVFQDNTADYAGNSELSHHKSRQARDTDDGTPCRNRSQSPFFTRPMIAGTETETRARIAKSVFHALQWDVARNVFASVVPRHPEPAAVEHEIQPTLQAAWAKVDNVETVTKEVKEEMDEPQCEW